MSKLSPLHEISSNFFINMSQAEFMSGTICFILCALKVGVRVLRMRFHSSPWATVNILSRGSGNLSSTCQRKTFLTGGNNLLTGDDEAQRVREPMRLREFGNLGMYQSWPLTKPRMDFGSDSGSESDRIGSDIGLISSLRFNNDTGG